MTVTTNTTTLADLVQRVRYRTDQENSTFVSDTELEQYIQESYFELYDLIIESVGPDHFINSHTFTTTSGDAEYPLVSSEDSNGRPLNIYKIVAVGVSIDGSAADYRPIRRFSLNDYWKYAAVDGWNSPESVFYNVSTRIPAAGEYGGNQYREINFIPKPLGAHSVTILFIPTPIEMSDSGTEIYFLHFTHWDEYIVVDAAAKVLEKEESEAGHLYKRKEELRQRILWHANTMNTEDAGSVNDVASRHSFLGPYRGEPWF